MSRRWSALALVPLAAAAALAGCPDIGTECPCTACNTAIALNVVDAAGNAVIDDWTAEATVDGIPVDTSPCTPGSRGATNACSFGFETGVYVIVVRTPFEEQEVAARYSSSAADDCCTFGCIGRTTNVVLTLAETTAAP